MTSLPAHRSLPTDMNEPVSLYCRLSAARIVRLCVTARSRIRSRSTWNENVSQKLRGS